MNNDINVIDYRDYEELERNVALTSKMVKKEYLNDITTYKVKPLEVNLYESVYKDISGKGEYMQPLLEEENRISELEDTECISTEKKKKEIDNCNEQIDKILNAMKKEVSEVYKQGENDIFTSENYRFLKIKRFVYSNEEDNLQKLTTVFSAINSVDGNIIFIIDCKDGNEVDIFLGVRNNSVEGKDLISTQYNVLKSCFEGNFPGSIFEDTSKATPKVEQLIKDIEKQYTAVSVVSGVANQREKDKTEKKAFIQGIEKFIDSMKDKRYTAIIIADSLQGNEVAGIREGYENIYSALKPFSKSVVSVDRNESEAISKSITKGTSKTITEGLTKTTSHTIGTFSSNTIGMNAGINGSMSHSITETVGKEVSHAVSCKVGKVLGGAIGSAFGPAGTMIGAYVGNVIADAVLGSSVAKTKSTAEQNGTSIGGSFGINASHSWGKNESDTKSEAESHQVSNTELEQKSVGNTQTTGHGTSLQIENSDKRIENLLEKIEKQMKRLEDGEAYGMFNCCAYFMSSDPAINIVAANTYRALMIGQESSVETSKVNNWEQEYDDDKPRKDSFFFQIMEYIKTLSHPIFYVPGNDKLPITCTCGSIVNGMELPLHIGLPQKSVDGLPVIEQVPFGRNVQRLDIPQTVEEIKKAQEREKKSIELGKIYHMCSKSNSMVKLDLKSLTMHTFITGSTGSGKSNTCYQLLNKLGSKTHYLVIEPAKGEYKYVLGGNAHVYGTNAKVTDVLHINPFSFPEEIHVLEHIDRLIEIFNVCWPMYAAMPAVLKEAIEKAYMDAGWELNSSINCFEKKLFPCFSDVLLELQNVIARSSFSQEVKDNYSGALITRIKSLTNGINGQVFCTKETDIKELFDENSIVDISRIGSTETKALIMGILVMRLQEYRMSTRAEEGNEELKHVTVIEEAHNLLKRTSTEQSSESSNLLGKSVEMLANSIAEMRTYGEGFIIVDQAPGLLDLSVIRNTNTKIIMRLPDLSDRKLVGSAAGLNDKQIESLMKLKTGVGVVYQNDWLEPVLCSIEEYTGKSKYKKVQEQILKTDESVLGKTVECILKKVNGEKVADKVDNLKDELLNSNLPILYKKEMAETLEHPLKYGDLEAVSKIVTMPFDVKTSLFAAKRTKNFEEWNTEMIEKMKPIITYIDELYRKMLIQCVLIEKSKESNEFSELTNAWIEYMKGAKIC